MGESKTMSNILRNALKLTPALLGAVLLLANRTQAAETFVTQLAPSSSVVALSKTTTSPKPTVSSVQPQLVASNRTKSTISLANQSSQVPDLLAQATSSQLSTSEPDAIAQVTSVSQLSDVQPNDWAFQALQSLVERYGCIAGYPDGTYRGNRALTRYEFAAGLNACLDRVNELIAAATTNQISREDLATLQRLQEEFSAELATLRGRVDALEAQTAELEANQFSTTTKLNGEVIFALADVFSDEDLDYNTILADRVRLNFDTSFTGSDRLRVRLQARNVDDNSDDTGTYMTRLSFDGDEENDIQIDDLYYSFPIGDVLLVQINAANTEFYDNIFTFNPAFESSGDGAISRFGRFSPIYRQGAGGAGLTLTFNPEGRLSVSAGYLAPSAEDPEDGFGVLDGAYAAIGQVAFKPSDALNIGVTYAHTYQNSPDQESEINLFDSTGSFLANRPFGNFATEADHIGVQASVRFGSALTLSGWGGYTFADPIAGPFDDEDQAEILNWAATLALQDFGTEGSQLGLIFGQPPKVIDGGVIEDEDTSYHLEALYKLQLSDNIAITPGVIVIFNPEHNDDRDDIYVGTVRTTFTF